MTSREGGECENEKKRQSVCAFVCVVVVVVGLAAAAVVRRKGAEGLGRERRVARTHEEKCLRV